MKLLAWHYRETLSLKMKLGMLAKRMTDRRYGATDPTSAIQKIMLTVNVLLVYPTHSEGNQAMWLLPLPFPRAFVSQITLQ